MISKGTELQLKRPYPSSNCHDPDPSYSTEARKYELLRHIVR